MEKDDILKRQKYTAELKIAILNEISKAIENGLDLEDIIGTIEMAKHMATIGSMNAAKTPSESMIGYR